MNLERVVEEGERYKKISYDHHAIERLFVDDFLDAHAEVPAEMPARATRRSSWAI